MEGITCRLPIRRLYPEIPTEHTFCYLYLIFLLGGLSGWIYEGIFYRITEGTLQNRGILFGPCLPIYGLGALGIYAAGPLKRRPVLLFLCCTAVTAVVEYLIGVLSVFVFGLRLWDYRGLFLNLQGIICLRSVVSFGLLGLGFHYLLEPLTAGLIRRVSGRTLQRGCLLLLGILLADCILSALFRRPITY